MKREEAKNELSLTYFSYAFIDNGEDQNNYYYLGVDEEGQIEMKYNKIKKQYFTRTSNSWEVAEV